jgi:hypothetical protein
MKRLNKTKLAPFERDLVEGLEGFVKDLKNNEHIPDKYTRRRKRRTRPKRDGKNRRQ